MLENSFQNIEQQKHYHNFWGDPLELWPSIYAKFSQNSSIWSEDIEKNHIFTSIKGHFVYEQI